MCIKGSTRKSVSYHSPTNELPYPNSASPHHYQESQHPYTSSTPVSHHRHTSEIARPWQKVTVSFQMSHWCLPKSHHISPVIHHFPTNELPQYEPLFPTNYHISATEPLHPNQRVTTSNQRATTSKPMRHQVRPMSCHEVRIWLLISFSHESVVLQARAVSLAFHSCPIKKLGTKASPPRYFKIIHLEVLVSGWVPTRCESMA